MAATSIKIPEGLKTHQYQRMLQEPKLSAATDAVGLIWEFSHKRAPMGSNKIRVGVIGTGFGLSAHIPGFQFTPETEVVAVWSRRRERAEAAARQYEIPYAFTDYQQMLAMKEIDLVSITSPVFMHFPMVMDALDAGKHVLCEKPLALTLDEAKKMYLKASSVNLTAMVGHEMRYIPAWTKMKELAEQGYLGELRHLIYNRVLGVPKDPVGAVPWSWKSDEAQGGGALGGWQSHCSDTIRWWFGEFTGVFGQIETYIKERKDPETGEWRPATGDDTHAFVFRMANGALGSAYATAFTSIDLKSGSGCYVEAYGTEGNLIIEDENHLKGGRVGDNALKEIPLPSLPQVSHSNSYRIGTIMLLIKDMLKGIREGTSPSPNFYDGLKHMEFIEALRLSQSQGRWVTLPLLQEDFLKESP